MTEGIDGPCFWTRCCTLSFCSASARLHIHMAIESELDPTVDSRKWILLWIRALRVDSAVQPCLRDTGGRIIYERMQNIETSYDLCILIDGKIRW